MRRQIEQYLHDGYFAQGVSLLRQSGLVKYQQIRHFEVYLQRSFVPAAIENQLKLLLESLLPSFPDVQPPGHVDIVQTHGRASLQRTDNVQTHGGASLPFWTNFFNQHPEAPKALLELHQQAILLHKEQSRIHPLMAQAARDGNRKLAFEYAQQRLEGQEQLDNLYYAAREWQTTGKLPPAPQRSTDASDVMAKMKQVKYLTERLCRLRKWQSEGQKEKMRDGKKVMMILNALELQEMAKEQLDKELELKELKDELGL